MDIGIVFFLIQWYPLFHQVHCLGPDSLLLQILEINRFILNKAFIHILLQN